MCDIVSNMKTATVRHVQHNFAAVLEAVRKGPRATAALPRAKSSARCAGEVLSAYFDSGAITKWYLPERGAS